MNAIPQNQNFDGADEIALDTDGEVAQSLDCAIAPIPEIAASCMVERAPFAEALAIVGRVVETRNTIPILSNVLLVGSAKSLKITATDLDIEITATVAAESDNDFRVTMVGDKLAALLKKAPACELVAIDTKPGANQGGGRGGHARLEFEKVNYLLPTLPVADFPELAVGELSHRFTMSGKVLWDMFDSTMGAISTEETRYYLNGVYFHAHGTKQWRWDDATQGMVELPCNFASLRAVSTDGHRLYMQENDLPDGADGMPGVILPRKLVHLLWSLWKGKACPESVHVGVSETKVRIAWGDVYVVSKLIDGTFPDYQRVMPSGNPRVAVFNGPALAEAVGAVALVLEKHSRAIKFDLIDGECRLVASHPENGSANSKVVCSFKSSDAEMPAELEIGLNASYLTELLAETGDGDVIAEFGDAGSPVVWRGAREGWTGVMMPLRV